MIRGSLALLATFVASFTLAACGPPPPPPGTCVGPNCTCHGGPDCDLECPAVGCVSECFDVSNCDSACGDMCTLSCHDTSNCDLVCGDDCAAECTSVSGCQVECGERCDVECRSLSNCDVVMVSGEVTCEGVGNCDVRCALPDGSTVAAEDCGGGVRRCPAGSC